MADLYSAILSTCSLLISGGTAWLTLGRRGVVKTTQPTFISFTFGPKGPIVLLRTLLYSTAKRGNVVESLFLRLKRGESEQTFNVWVHGHKPADFARGSGLFVSSDGTVATHYFMLPKDGTEFRFLPGEYSLEVFAKRVGTEIPTSVMKQRVTLPADLANLAEQSKTPILFDWGPEAGAYHAHIDTSRNELGPAAKPPNLSAVFVVELAPIETPVLKMGREQAEVRYTIRLRNMASFPITPKVLELTLFLSCGDVNRDTKRRVERALPTLGPSETFVFAEDWVFPAPDRRATGAARIAFTGRLVADGEPWGGARETDVASFSFGPVKDDRLPS